MFKLGSVTIAGAIAFLLGFYSAQATVALSATAVELRALPADGSSVEIGQSIDYTWSPVSTRQNCVQFKPPGQTSWGDWVCWGRGVGSFSKDTSGLLSGQLSAKAAIKKCGFLGLICSWDYSNIVSHDLVSQPSAPEPQPSNCVGTGVNRRCLDLIPLGGTVAGGGSASTFAKISWSRPVSAAKTIFFDALPPLGVTASWPNGRACTVPAGQLSCGVNISFNSSPVAKTVTYSIPVEAEAGPSQNFELTVEKSKNSSPSVSPLPPRGPADYCVSPLDWTLSWNFNDADANSFQSAYQIKIFDALTRREVLSRLYYSSSQSFAVPAGTLAFNKSYAWKIKVWDNEYATAEAEGENFTTLPHRAPHVNFYWKPYPQRISAGEKIDFYDNTDFYDTAPPKRSWSWVLPSGLIPITGTDTYNISARAEKSGSYNVALRSTDSEGLTCSAAKTLSVGRGLPQIKEILPR